MTGQETMGTYQNERFRLDMGKIVSDEDHQAVEEADQRGCAMSSPGVF